MPQVGTTNRIFTLKLNGLYATQPTLNVFHYRQSALLQSSAEDVANYFVANQLDNIKAVQNNTQSYTSVEVIDSNDVENFYTAAISLTGDITSLEPTASFIAWSLRLLRSSRDMRSGWKRFAGLNEADISGQALATTYRTFVSTLAPLMVAPIIDVIAELPLCIVRSRPTAKTPLVDPEDPATWYYTDVAGWTIPNRVTTQNSRKFF